MKKLNQNWLTEGLVDFEYKKYILLAYLKTIRSEFDEGRLYPFLADLIFHYNNLLHIKTNQELLQEHFPKKLSRIDFEKLKLVYEKILEDSDLMREIDDLVHYSIPKIEVLMGEGKELYELIEKQLQLDEVGLSPLYREEGYLLLNSDYRDEVLIYRYQLSKIQTQDDKLISLQTEWLSNEKKPRFSGFTHIKQMLIRQFTDLPNPATYVVHSSGFYPIQPTLLPIAKRMLVRHISSPL